MKINKMIKELQKVEKMFGDVEVVMSSDSEGNSYSTIDENFRYSRVYEHESDFIKANDRGLISGNPIDIVGDFYNKAKVIGICLFPWQEHFDYADQAVQYNTQQEAGA